VDGQLELPTKEKSVKSKIDELNQLLAQDGSNLMNVSQKLQHDVEIVKASTKLKNRPLLFGLTRLAQENLLQLWLQSSFFSLVFAFTTNIAKSKSILSMGIGFLVALSKLAPMVSVFVESLGEDVKKCGGTGWGFMFFLIFCAFVTFWIPAKVYFAFVCESHVWNLSTGCVELA